MTFRDEIKASFVNSDVDISEETLDKEYNKYKITFHDLTEFANISNGASTPSSS